jgi:tetratricopeptide (TPR) repeat protein
MKNQNVTYNMNRNLIWILAGLIYVWVLLSLLGTSGYPEAARYTGDSPHSSRGMGDFPHEGYTLFVGEFENRTDIVNPLLDFVNDTLDFLFSRSQLADIHPVSPALRSAYLQRARNEQPNVDATQLNLLAAEYGKADAVLVGGYSKTGAQWTMDAQLYVTREGSRAKEDIHLSGDDVYRLLDGLAAEVSKRLGTGEYMLLSTPSWEAYEAYRQGHQAYYNFDNLAAVRHFQRAIELDPQLAIAHAELGLCHLMLNDIPEVDKAMAEAEKNVQNVSEQERLIVMGLACYYKADRHAFMGSEGVSTFPDLPRLRDDTVWDEPWLRWHIARSSGDESVRDREYKQWLTSALAYAKAGFYGAPELAEAGVERPEGLTTGSEFGRCVSAFNITKDPQFLEAALQFIGQAADVDANDAYDDAWKHWHLSRIYSLMDRRTDMQQQREEWLRIVKSKPPDDLSPGVINDIARKCLGIGSLKDALDFAFRAVELESDLDLRSQYLLTLADIRSASGELDEAFSLYLEAFEASERGDAGTGVLGDSLSGLTRLISDNPELVDEAIRTKLNQMTESIKNMDPMLFRSESAQATIKSGTTFGSIENFCLEVGDIEPALMLVRGMLEAETDPSEQLTFLSYLSRSEGGITESELGLLEKVRSGFGGFELGVPGTLRFSGNGSIEVVSELVGAAVPEDPVEGEFCLHVTVNKAGTNYWEAQILDAGYVFQEGKVYTLAAFLKAKEGTFNINFCPQLPQDPWTSYGAEILTMTDTWAEYHVTTPPMPETVNPARITFHVGFSAGQFWMDVVRFYEGEFVPYEGSPDPLQKGVKE